MGIQKISLFRYRKSKPYLFRYTIATFQHHYQYDLPKVAKTLFNTFMSKNCRWFTFICLSLFAIEGGLLIPIERAFVNANEGKLWRHHKEKYLALEAEKAPDYRVIR